ncbi:MAG: polysaccharide deacetylase family protein [Leptolyngbya sp. SIO1E4]|nr:polysaccharide deacetylase family protein [Leptolyngbya sp. SIO1E4]
MQPALKAPPSPLRLPKRPRHRWLRYCAIVIAIAVLVSTWEPYLWSNRYRVPWVFGEVVYKVQTPDKVVALTFDDGPDPRYTEQISQLLVDAGVRSTFFVMGRHAEQHPELIDTLIQHGHELGNHTWNHPSLRLTPPNRIRAELESTDRLLREHGYQQPIPFRAPYGHSWFVLPQILKQRQQSNILWTVQLNDWKPERPDVMMDLLEPKFDNGAIILLHDGDGESEGADRANTVEVVKLILEKYIPQGYQFVTVSELLTHGNPLPYQ